MEDIQKEKILQRSELGLGKRTNILKLKNQGYLDGMTSLKNRKYLIEFDGQLNEHKRIGGSRNVFAFDFNNFKRVNDDIGHAIADLAILEFADLLKNIFTRDGDNIFRWQGDEYYAITTIIDDVENAEDFANNINEIINSEMQAVLSDVEGGENLAKYPTLKKLKESNDFGFGVSSGYYAWGADNNVDALKAIEYAERDMMKNKLSLKNK
jgi:diguanylate cyclase (GGDEF)-like protein